MSFNNISFIFILIIYKFIFKICNDLAKQ